MQNQLIPAQTNNLQQPAGNLQQNNSTLQQSGTPDVSSNASGLLSQTYNGELQVQASQTDPGAAPQTYLPTTPNYGLIFIIFVGIVVFFTVLFWQQLTASEEVEQSEPEPLPVPPVAPAKPKKPKNGKKSTRRQRSRK